jgi:Right handed beta helix region
MFKKCKFAEFAPRDRANRFFSVRNPTLWSLSGALPLIVLTANTEAAVLSVCSTGCKYTTIQSAVNAAADKDQISIAKGIYTENVNIDGKTLVLDGAGSEFTTIDGSRVAAPVFTLGSATHPEPTWHHITLQNMTITGGHKTFDKGGTGGGVLVRPGAALILRSSVVISNSADTAGGGIALLNPGGPISEIVDSRIEANRAAPLGSDRISSRGGGIYVGPDSSLSISDSQIRGNSTHAGGGGLQSDTGSQVWITRSDFEGNSAPGFFFLGVNQGCGGGIAADSQMTISDTTIRGNFADLGGGICASVGLDKQIVQVTRTTISGNTAGGGQEDSGPVGAGINVSNGGPTHTTEVILDHVYLSENENVGTSLEEDLVTLGKVKVQFTDTTIKDPVNAGCIGASCTQ